MPLYEYECGGCGHRFERIQKFSDPPITECPKCGGAVQKLLSSPAIQFKGSGWYITDYARSGKSDGGSVKAGKTESAPAETAKSDSAKSDSSASGGTGGSGSTGSAAAPATPSK